MGELVNNLQLVYGQGASVESQMQSGGCYAQEKRTIRTTRQPSATLASRKIVKCKQRNKQTTKNAKEKAKKHEIQM